MVRVERATATGLWRWASVGWPAVSPRWPSWAPPRVCRPAADPCTDARIEAEVKACLVAQHNADRTRLGEVSNDGTVYLTGAVPSSEDKARAASVAGTVSGVGKVVNALDVRPGRK